MIKLRISYQIFFYLFIVFSLSGCIELLELGTEDLAEVGLSESELGTLSIVNPELVNTELENVRLGANDQLYINRNGSQNSFGELISDNEIRIFKNNKIVKLPGVLHSVNEDVFVRQSPLYDASNSNIISKYGKGRLVIVSGEINGWSEIQLADHIIGFIPSTSLSVTKNTNLSENSQSNSISKHCGYRENINYIINQNFKNEANSKDMIVNITYTDGSFDENTSNSVSQICIKKGYHSTASFFSKFYYEDCIYNELFLGNKSYINKLKLYEHADYLLIGSYSIKIRPNQIKDDMLTCELDFSINKVNLQNGNVENTISRNISGNGWSYEGARNDAMQTFFQIIQQSNY